MTPKATTKFTGLHVGPTFTHERVGGLTADHELMEMLRGHGTVKVSLAALSKALKQGGEAYAITVDCNGVRQFAVQIVS